MSTITANQFKSTDILGNLHVAPLASVGGNATVDATLNVKGSLVLGAETQQLVEGVTVFTDTGGNIQVLLQGVLYTLTPTQIKYLSTLSGDISSLFAAAQSYTDFKIAQLVGTAPGTLDTLWELAAALQADQTSIAALNTAINTKAGLSQNNSFTGTNTFAGISVSSLNSIPSTQISYLGGVTSSIQNQLNALTNSVAARLPLASPSVGTGWMSFANISGSLPSTPYFGAIATNLSSGQAELAFLNTATAIQGTTLLAFRWTKMLTSTTTAHLMWLTNGGNLSVLGNVNAAGATFTSLPTCAATPANGSDLVNKAHLDAQLAGYITPTALTTALTPYALSTSLNNYVLTSALTTTLGSYVTNAALTTALAPYALSAALNDYVLSSSLTTTLGGYGTLGGSQTWAGANTFTNTLICEAAPAIWSHLCNRLYVDSKVGTVQSNLNSAITAIYSSNRSWSGLQTFNTLPVSATTPTSANQLVPKSYVDGAVSGAVAGLATTGYVDQEIATRATMAYVDEQIAAAEVYTDQQILTRITPSAVDAKISAAIEPLATIEYVNSAATGSVTGLATTAYVDEQILTRTNAGDVALMLLPFARTEDLNNGLGATVDYIDTKLLDYVPNSFLELALGEYTTTSVLNTMLTDYATKDFVNGGFLSLTFFDAAMTAGDYASKTYTRNYADAVGSLAQSYTDLQRTNMLAAANTWTARQTFTLPPSCPALAPDDYTSSDYLANKRYVDWKITGMLGEYATSHYVDTEVASRTTPFEVGNLITTALVPYAQKTYVDSAVATKTSPADVDTKIATSKATFLAGANVFTGAQSFGAATATSLTSTTSSLGATTVTTLNGLSSTTLGYLSGVSSAIQNQLNAKAPSASPVFTSYGYFQNVNGNLPLSTAFLALGSNYSAGHAEGNFVNTYTTNVGSSTSDAFRFSKLNAGGASMLDLVKIKCNGDTSILTKLTTPQLAGLSATTPLVIPYRTTQSWFRAVDLSIPNPFVGASAKIQVQHAWTGREPTSTTIQLSLGQDTGTAVPNYCTGTWWVDGAADVSTPSILAAKVVATTSPTVFQVWLRSESYRQLSLHVTAESVACTFPSTFPEVSTDPATGASYVWTVPPNGLYIDRLTVPTLAATTLTATTLTAGGVKLPTSSTYTAPANDGSLGGRITAAVETSFNNSNAATLSIKWPGTYYVVAQVNGLNCGNPDGAGLNINLWTSQDTNFFSQGMVWNGAATISMNVSGVFVFEGPLLGALGNNTGLVYLTASGSATVQSCTGGRIVATRIG